jgi:hypothetical protein
MVERIAREASIPSMFPPRIISMSTRSGLSPGSFSTASSPEWIVATTSYPSLTSIFLISAAIIISSSTTAILPIGVFFLPWREPDLSYRSALGY